MEISLGVFCLLLFWAFLPAIFLGWVLSLCSALKTAKREQMYLLEETNRNRKELQGKRENNSLETEKQWAMLWQNVVSYRKGYFSVRRPQQDSWEQLNAEIVKLQNVHFTPEQVLGIRKLLFTLANGIYYTRQDNEKLAPLLNQKIVFDEEGGFSIEEAK